MPKDITGKAVNLYLSYPHIAALKRHTDNVSGFITELVEEALCSRDKELRDYVKARDQWKKHSKK